jgi:TQXA domain-containing protein
MQVIKRIPKHRQAKRTAARRLSKENQNKPHTRLRGGDIYIGKKHIEIGHAGRTRMPWSMGIASICMILIIVFSLYPLQAIADTTVVFMNDHDQANSGSVGPYDQSFGAYRRQDDAGVSGIAYCLQIDVPGPLYSGTPYTSSGLTKDVVLSYLIAHGYPNSTTLANHKLSAGDARAATQIAIWKYMSSTRAAEELENTPDWLIASDFLVEALAYRDSGGKACGVGTVWQSQNRQNLLLTGIPKGSIALKKESLNPSISNGNGCYSFEGAEYGVYADEKCTDKKGILLLGADGRSSNVSNLPIGTYYVREIKAPRGYAKNASTYTVKVEAGKTSTVTATDEPQSDQPDVLVVKADADTKKSSVQGDATFEGAEFEIRFYAGLYDKANLPSTYSRTWKLKTDDRGTTGLIQAYENPAKYFIAGDEFYQNSSGKPVLPLGTVAIRETKAPAGYELTDSSWHTQHVTASGDMPTVESFVVPDESSPTVLEKIIRGGIHLSKVDSTTGKQSAQGDASLSGAEFTIWNRSSHDVIVDGKAYAPNTACLVLSTDAYGVAESSSNVLPFGSYEVRETKAPRGYDLDNEFCVPFQIRDPNVIVDLSSIKASDPIWSGSVTIQKRDAECHGAQPLGSASFEGITFEIRNDSARPVMVNGISYAVGSTVQTLETNSDGLATSLPLPYGTYAIKETGNGRGYLRNQSWSQSFKIRQNGQKIDLTNVGIAVENQIYRGDLSFSKKDDVTGDTMANIPFMVSSLSTGEAHVLMTDENGMASTAADWNAHTHSTNANDAAVTKKDNGTYIVDEDKLVASAGIWFGQYGSERGKDLLTSPNDQLGALPYDSIADEGGYLIEELPCSSNKGRRLISTTISITRNGKTLDFGTIDDRHISIGTELTSLDSSHTASASNITLKDTVSYEGLTPGKTYVIKGTLHTIGEDGSDGGELKGQNGKPIASIKTFTTTSSSGNIIVSFSFDASNLSGKQVVAFEELSQDNVVIAQHCNVSSMSQTVGFPKIQTTAISADTAAHDSLANSSMTVLDTVRYEGLTPGTTYLLSGHLIDSQTGRPALDDSGIEVSSQTEITPSAHCGTAIVKFPFSGTRLVGHTLVAFEKLETKNGTTIATHEDLNDSEQMLFIPSISTSAANEAGSKFIQASDDQTIVDTIAYENLLPDTDYEARGELHLVGIAENGEKIDKGLVGNSLTATFHTPFASDGRRTVSDKKSIKFDVDLSKIAGNDLVVFESLYRAGIEVAAHKNINDIKQTIHIPKIATQAKDTTTASHQGISTDQTSLIDEVQYSNLIPGKSYVLLGTLYDKESGKPYQVNNANITSKKVFVPKEASGTTSVTFSFDGRDLGGHTLVVFETLSHGQTVIAAHADINDEAQSIFYNPPTPSIPDTPITPNTTEQASSLVRTIMPHTGTGIAMLVFTACGVFALTAGLISKHRHTHKNSSKHHYDL